MSIDDPARRLAVQPERSVILQAPAGSGKTTLLVERYLRLLSTVQAPEAVLAITFTRKAAAEMRSRVLRYLDPNFDSDEPHEQAPLKAARSIADKVKGWCLHENPQRLLIRTIDSFNHFLARSMPVATQLGPVPSPSDNAQALYRRTARRVLGLIDSNDALGPHLNRLLDWRDHHSQSLEDLVTELLGRRDQWLRALGTAGGARREALEAALELVVVNQLHIAQTRLEQALAKAEVDAAELLALLKFAADNLQSAGRASALQVFAADTQLPSENPDSLPAWRGLAEALLTQEGQFRKPTGINSRLGFIPKSNEKAAFCELLEKLSETTALPRALHNARSLPTPRYEAADWQVLDSLLQVLVRAASELELLFAQTGQTDYAGLAAAALRGLGDDNLGITDLGLYLDHRIQHILVDEFQDTNWSQLHLLEKLTAGWEPDDGRSLFLVGDPMQSIYRFREAEVGLFIRCREQGIGAVALEYARLERNFRSRSEIVHWVNAHLGPMFPEREDISAGAVAYAPSAPGRARGGAVDLRAWSDATAEAEGIAALVSDALATQGPDYKIAILVKARSHFRALLAALGQWNIPFRAVKLDPLLSQMLIQDLLAITRVIQLPSDVAAWLAMLRAPTCGLTLAQLHALAGDGRSLLTPDALERLDPDGRERAGRVFSAIADAQAQWRRRSLADLVAGVWARLGGPQCCAAPRTDLRDAQRYFQALDQAEGSGLIDDWHGFLESLSDAFTEGDAASDATQVEVLTMHGAKGLEWDMVVLPALNKPPPPSDSPLLYWLPLSTPDGEEQVLLAPRRSSEHAEDPPLVSLIRREQQQRAAYENQRLLYVAATRARERLVLSAQIDTEKAEFRPAKGSLLHDLWATTAAGFMQALGVSVQPDAEPVEPTQSLPDQRLHRVATNWQPHVPASLEWQPKLPLAQPAAEIEYDWAGRIARTTGTVLHRLLEHVGTLGIEQLNPAGRRLLLGRVPLLLQNMGIVAQALDEAADIIRQALETTLDSDIGKWLLSGQHRQSACELAVSGLIDGQLTNLVVDRTFVDAQGIRWIIDYKSGYHAGGDPAGFFAQEAGRYSAQLDRYRVLVATLGSEPTRCALFLPRHNHLEVLDTLSLERP